MELKKSLLVLLSVNLRNISIFPLLSVNLPLRLTVALKANSLTKKC